MMAEKAFLVLEDGTIFEGKAFGKRGETVGDIVFTTSMGGYLETLTDPGLYGQIMLHTFPLIGNYGVISADFQSSKVWAAGYIVKHVCQDPSNFRCEGTLDTFLKEQGVVGLYGIDTRKLTKIIRDNGIMKGKITMTEPTKSDQADAKSHTLLNAVAAVSKGNGGKLPMPEGTPAPKYKVALINYGAKNGIIDCLQQRGCDVYEFAWTATKEEIMAINPDGIVLSNGPGDPAETTNRNAIQVIKELIETNVPMFGICLGHSLLALAHGYKTASMKFGHRGSNQPVKDVKSGRVYVTPQAHGHVVVAKDSWFINVNDGTCEGLDYGKSFGVQFHPQGKGGAKDTEFLFDVFVERMTV